MRCTYLLLLFLLPAISIAGADKIGIYKSVDAEGNIVYSDTPSIGAEKIQPPPISTIDSRPTADTAPASADDTSTKPPTSYTSFTILQPGNDVTIWDNQGSIPLSLKLEPGLDTANGHGVWVYVDGKAVVRQSPSLVQPISGIDRGTHTVRAEIRDKTGRVLMRTKTINVHLKKHTAPRPTPH
jgi:hypothetical protein